MQKPWIQNVYITLFVSLSMIVWFTRASNLDLSSFAATDLYFGYRGNSFSAKLFLKDFKTASQTVRLNSESKYCTQQVRGYYFNPARWLRIRPLDVDSLSYLRTIDDSYNTLTLSGGIFICNGSDQALYGSIVHRRRFNTYYLIAGVNYNFINNSYLPNFLQSMLFANWLSLWYIFDSYGGIASLFWSGLIVPVSTWSSGWWGAWGGWLWWGAWGWGGQTDIPIYTTWLEMITGLKIETWTNIPPSMNSWLMIKNSPYSEELTNAYLFAYKIGITTQWPIERANLHGELLRKHAAKMIAQFAINIMDKKPNDPTRCIFSDMKKESLEMQYYAELACKLGLMWLQSDGKPNTVFSPNAIVTRAQFGTMFSRLLYGNRYNAPAVWSDYYSPHLKALQKAGIMKNISQPRNFELRGNVMIMMQRVANK